MELYNPITERTSLNTDKAAVKQFALTYQFSSKKITKLFLVIVFALLIAHTFSLSISSIYPGYLITNILVGFFDMGREENFPTVFSSFLLFFASVLSFIVFKKESSIKQKNSRDWLILSMVFLFLCLDEAIRIHEQFILITRHFLPKNASGFFYNAWVIPYAFLTMVFGIYFFRFLYQLPKKTRLLTVLSGLIYVFGALGFEFLEGYHEKKYGKDAIVHLYETIEEVLEMGGMILFIHALFDFLKINALKIRFS